MNIATHNSNIEIYNHDAECELLKPCPFCGGIPYWHLKGNDHTSSRTIVIKCSHCGVEMKMSGKALGIQPIVSRIIEKWNNRK